MKKVLSVILVILMVASIVPFSVIAANAEGIGVNNRAQWLAKLTETFDMVVELEDYPDNYFSDLDSSSPYYDAIMVATEFGLVDIEAGNPVYPEGDITREFAAHTLNFCLAFKRDENNTEYLFSDYEDCAYPDDDQVAIEKDWLALQDGKFNPALSVTDAEITAMIDFAQRTLLQETVQENYNSSCTFAQYVVEVPEGVSVEIDEDYTVTIINCPTEINKGDTFAVYYYEIPYVFVAESVTRDGNITTITTSEADESKAIEDIDIQNSLDIDPSDIELSKEFEIVEEPSGGDASAQARDKSLTIKYSDRNTQDFLELYLTLSDMKFDYNITDETKFVELSFDLEASASYGSKLSVDEAKRKKFDLVEYLKKKGIKSIGKLRYGLVFVEFSPVMEISGKYEAKYKQRVTLGFSVNGYSFRNLTSFKKKSSSLKVEAEVKYGIEISVGLMIPFVEGRIYGGAGYMGNVTTVITSDTEKTVCCYGLSVYYYANCGAEIKIETVFSNEISINYEITIYDLKNSPVRLNFHFENGQRVKKCTVGSEMNHSYLTPESSKLGESSGYCADSDLQAEDFVLAPYSGSSPDSNLRRLVAYNGYEEDLRIPYAINHYRIDSIAGGAFSNCSDLNSVIIGKGTRSIAHGAFIYCESITSVTIPDSVKSIGSSAFYGCSGLTSISIPDSVKTIEADTFTNCSNLTSAKIGKGVKSIGHDAFSGCSSLTNVEIPDSVTSIGEKAFYECNALTSAQVGNSVTNIGKEAFYGSGLKSVTLPNSVKVIEERALSNCQSLESLTIGNGITYMGSNAFEYCTALENLTIEDGATVIGVYAFFGCNSLSCVTIPDSVTTIGSGAFCDCGALMSITVGSGVTSIGDGAFSGCESLIKVNITGLQSWCNISFYNGTSNPLYYSKNLFVDDELITDLVIPGNVSNISDYAFYGCSGLTTLKIPDGVESIGNYSFSLCTGLSGVTMGIDVKSIGESAFFGCTALTSIAIPGGVTNINNYAFSGCKNIIIVKIGVGVMTIGDHAFSGCSGIREVYYSAPESYWNHISIGDDNDYLNIAARYYISEGACGENVNYNFDWKSGLLTISGTGNMSDYGSKGSPFYSQTEIKEIIITEGVRKIGKYSFRDCRGLKKVKLPKSVTSIGNHAFYGCTGLTDIEIPEDVTAIGAYAFYGCSGLTSIEIPNGVTSISNGAFYGCTGLKDIEIPNGVTSIGDSAFYSCSSLTSIEIPNGVTSIGESAFSFSGLTNVTIPDSVTAIGSDAFSHCSRLTDINIGSGVTSIGDMAFYLSGNLTNVYIKSIEAWCKISFISPSSTPFYHAHHLYLNGKEITDLIIPSGITNISMYAFRNCSSIKSVTIPESVTRIGYQAFFECNDLTDVYYCGSEDDWNNISVASYNESLNSATMHFNHSVNEIQYTVSTLANTSGTIYLYSADELIYSADSEGGIFTLSGIATGTYDVYVMRKFGVLTKVPEQLTVDGAQHSLDSDIYIPVGNVNGDDIIDIADLSMLISAGNYGNENTNIDLTGDGLIDISDISLLLKAENYGMSSAKTV